MRRTLQRATVIGGLALVGLLPIGASANASTPTTATTTMTATASAATDESRICCVMGPYPTQGYCEMARAYWPTSTPCYQGPINGKWYFNYRP